MTSQVSIPVVVDEPSGVLGGIATNWIIVVSIPVVVDEPSGVRQSFHQENRNMESQSLLSWMSPRAHAHHGSDTPTDRRVSIPVVVDEPSGARARGRQQRLHAVDVRVSIPVVVDEPSGGADGARAVSRKTRSQSLLSWMSPRALDVGGNDASETRSLNPCCRG